MRPMLGCVVIFTRSEGEEFAARITRVVAKPLPAAAIEARWKEIVADDPTLDGLSKPDVRRMMDGDERSYEVWLAVDVHTRIGGRTWYSDAPIKFDAQSAQLSWRWPEIGR